MNHELEKTYRVTFYFTVDDPLKDEKLIRAQNVLNAQGITAIEQREEMKSPMLQQVELYFIGQMSLAALHHSFESLLIKPWFAGGCEAAEFTEL